MKISVNWLKKYIDIKLPAEKLAYVLNMAGWGVEKTTSAGDDTVFELEITPNRPDCLSYIGIARDLSAVLNRALKVPLAKPLQQVRSKTNISIQDKKGCPRYIGAVVKNLK